MPPATTRQAQCEAVLIAVAEAWHHRLATCMHATPSGGETLCPSECTLHVLADQAPPWLHRIKRMVWYGTA